MYFIFLLFLPGPHLHLLSIREFNLDIDPLCNLDVHHWTHPQSLHPPPPGGSSEPPPGNYAHTANCQLLRYMTIQ